MLKTLIVMIATTMKMMTKLRVRLEPKRYWRLKKGRTVFTTVGFDPGCNCRELSKKEFRKLLADGWRRGRFKRPFPNVEPGWWVE